MLHLLLLDLFSSARKEVLDSARADVVTNTVLRSSRPGPFALPQSKFSDLCDAMDLLGVPSIVANELAAGRSVVVALEQYGAPANNRPRLCALLPWFRAYLYMIANDNWLGVHNKSQMDRRAGNRGILLRCISENKVRQKKVWVDGGSGSLPSA